MTTAHIILTLLALVPFIALIDVFWITRNNG